MTVAELIAELQKMPQDLPVYGYSDLSPTGITPLFGAEETEVNPAFYPGRMDGKGVLIR